MEKNEICSCLEDSGFSVKETDECMKLLEQKQNEAAMRRIRAYRCCLMDQMHEIQKKLDLLDGMVYQLRKEEKSI